MTRHPAHNVLAALFGEAWAILPEAHQQLVEIAARAHDAATEGGIDALEARLGRPLDNTHAVDVRDGVATIGVRGPMVRYASLFSRISGATSYATLATDLTAALDDADVGAILLHLDSPGGSVTGLSELAAHVHAARGVKPIHAHVSGLGASAAYWLASAAERITASDTAILGSIGVVMTVPGATPPRPGQAVEHEFVSSTSPNKRLDPGGDAGRAALQATVDALGRVFAETVARYRGVDVETVLAEFGQGGVFVGEAAVRAGLADAVRTYEQVHADLAADVAAARTGRFTGALGRSPLLLPPSSMSTRAAAPGAATPADGAAAAAQPPAAPTPAPVTPPALTAADVPADVAAQLRAEGATAERTRILAIQSLGVPGAEALVSAAVADASATPEQTALRILQAQRAGTATAPVPATADAGTQHLEALRADQAQRTALAPLHPDAAADAQPSAGPSGEAARILAAHHAVSGTPAAITPARR